MAYDWKKDFTNSIQPRCMAEPVFSPDGKFMWTGSEWIPRPPQADSVQNVSISDTVVMESRVLLCLWQGLMRS